MNWWRPVIQADPRTAGMMPSSLADALPWPRCGRRTPSRSRRRATSRRPGPSGPRACSTAMRAHRPVPVGLRSSRPGATTTALRVTAPTPSPGRRDLHDRDVVDGGVLGMHARQLLARGRADALAHERELARLAPARSRSPAPPRRRSRRTCRRRRRRR